MESTIKIGNSSRGIHSVPIIKIVQPIHLIKPDPLEDIDDVKDELISTFLHTPAMAYPNSFFMTTGRWLVPFENSKSQITIISAVEEGQLFHTFKHAIFERLISYENLCEAKELQHQREKGEIPDGTIHNAPYDYDRFLKITEFFDWVWEQTYNGDPVNTPIETRRDTVRETKIPLETIRDYFKLSLEQGERMNALDNTPSYILDTKVDSMADAIGSAFDINKTPQGAKYWQNVINRVG